VSIKVRTLREQYADLRGKAAEQDERRMALYALAKAHQSEADRLEAEGYAAEQLAYQYEEMAIAIEAAARQEMGA
jgi:hypothetical protein